MSAWNPDGPSQLKYNKSEIREYERILEMLDYRQHLNISAHLYSAYLISLRNPKPNPEFKRRQKVPYRAWTSWPKPEVPAPPQIYDEFPEEDPVLVSDEEMKDFTSQTAQSYPAGPSSSDTPAQVLTRAFDEYLQRIVNQKIHNDHRAANLEPLVEPSPQLDAQSVSKLKKIVDNYTDLLAPNRSGKPRQPIDWKHLRIQGKAAPRIARLFEREPEDEILEFQEELIDSDDSDFQASMDKSISVLEESSEELSN